MMRGRKWEDLEMNCLVNVLRRVGMESLLLNVPFVCKSWHKASLDPLCWERLVFGKIGSDPSSFRSLISRFIDEYRTKEVSETAFIKFIIDRSCKNATLLILPSICTNEALKYAADECPSLRTLALPRDYEQSFIIPELIGKWKNLEALSLGSSYNMTEILSQVNLNCKNIVALRVHGFIHEEEAMAIVTNLPKIKYLIISGIYIDREDLMTILKGCKVLLLLDAQKCIGYKADQEILKLASHIRTFKHKGSRYDDDDWESEGGRFYCWDDDYYSD